MRMTHFRVFVDESIMSRTFAFRPIVCVWICDVRSNVNVFLFGRLAIENRYFSPSFIHHFHHRRFHSKMVPPPMLANIQCNVTNKRSFVGDCCECALRSQPRWWLFPKLFRFADVGLERRKFFFSTIKLRSTRSTRRCSVGSCRKFLAFHRRRRRRRREWLLYLYNSSYSFVYLYFTTCNINVDQVL